MPNYTKNLNLFKYDPINDAKVPFDIEKCLNENWDKIDEKVAGMPVGTIFAHTCSASFVPENSLPCNGIEYTLAQFPTFFPDWLESGKLLTCTYEEQGQEIATYGKCVKFAIDIINRKFKTPYIPDGVHIQQAMTDGELGKSYNAGLPNITGTISRGMWRNNRTESVSFDGAGCFELSKQYPGGGVLVSGVDTNTNIKDTANFDASLASPIYGNSDTVQTEAVALRYFVVVATGSINQSEMDWSAWASSLQGKANVDMDNLSTAGRGEVTSLGMPSDEYIDLELKSSSKPYLAPFDCIVNFGKQATAAGQYIALGVLKEGKTTVTEENIEYYIDNWTPVANAGLNICIIVPKGRTFFAGYNAGGTTSRFREIKLKGAL